MIKELENLIQYNWFTVVAAIIVAMLAFKFLSELFEWFVNKFGIETKSMREKREQRDQLSETTELAKQTAKNLDKLENRHTKDEKEFRENLSKHMIESEKDRKAMHQEQTKISNSVQGLVDKFDEFQTDTNKRFNANEEKENKRVRAELKNSISGLYRHCHAIGKISDIDLETLEELIEEYEAAGGENSFVHSLVQKEMYTWEVVKRKLPDEI